MHTNMLSTLLRSSISSGQAGLGCMLPALQQGVHLVSGYATKAKATPPYLKDAAKGSKKGSETKKSKIPRAVSAYAWFVKEQSPLKAKENSGTKIPEIMKMLGAEWRSMTEQQKQPYMELAEESKMQAGAAREAAKKERGPPSAYQQWCKVITQELRTLNPHMRAPDMLKEAAARWNQLPEDEKQRRKAEANAAREDWKKQRTAV